MSRLPLRHTGIIFSTAIAMFRFRVKTYFLMPEYLNVNQAERKNFVLKNKDFFGFFLKCDSSNEPFHST